MATTYLKETLNFLGPEYQLNYIDGEDCIYRKLSDSYDIEVSGAYKNPIVSPYTSGTLLVALVTVPIL